MANLTKILDFTIIHPNYNNSISFARGGEVYLFTPSSFDFTELFGYEAESYGGGLGSCFDSYSSTDMGCEVENISNCTPLQLEQLALYSMDIQEAIECTAEYLEELANQKLAVRKSFLSNLFKSAWAHCKQYTRNFALSLREQYNRLKIATATVVTFFKLKKDSKEEVEVVTRRVTNFEILADGRYFFTDVSTPVFSKISFHPYQLLNFQ